MADFASVGSGNAGLRLLDACFDDIAYARYLLTSKRPQDLDVKTKVNWRDHATGNSILHCLSYADLETPLQLLLQHHADPNIRNKANEVPLHWCAKVNATKCIQMLLQFKANANAVDLSKSSALHYAVVNGHIESAVLLLDHDIDIMLQDSDGHTALEIAIDNGKIDAGRTMIAVLLRHCQRKGLSIPKTVRTKLGGILSARDGPVTASDPHILSDTATIQPQPRQQVDDASMTYNSNQVTTNDVSPPRMMHSRASSFLSGAVGGSGIPASFPAMLLAGSGSGGTPLTHTRSPSFAINNNNNTNNSTANISPTRSPSFAINPLSLAPITTLPTEFAPHPKTILDMIRSGDLKPTSSSPSPMSRVASMRGGMSSNNALGKIHEEGQRSTNNLLLKRMDSMSPATNNRRGSMSPNPNMNSQNNQLSSPPQKEQQPPLFVVRKVNNERGDFLSASFGSSLSGLDAPSPSKKGLSRSMAEPRRGSMDMQQLYQNQQQTPIDDSAIAQQAKELARRLGAEDHSQSEQQQRSGVPKPQPIITAAGAFPKNRRHMSASETLSAEYRHSLYTHEESHGTASATTTSRDHINGQTAATNTSTSAASDSHLTVATGTPKRIPTLAETSFPPADMLPFLPNPNPEQLGDLSPGHLDVIIAVEHCFDCHLHNGQSLRHDTKKYVSQANTVIYGLIKAIAEARLAVRLYAMRTQHMSVKRLGAMEVTVAVRIDLPRPPAPPTPKSTAPTPIMSNRFALMSGMNFSPFSTSNKPATEETSNNIENEQTNALLLKQQQRLRAEQEEEERNKLLQRWCTHRLHSKLQTKNWPHPKQLEQKVVKFLEATIRESVSLPNKYNYDKDRYAQDLGSGSRSTRHDQGHHSHNRTVSHPKLEFKHTEPDLERSKQVMRQYGEWANRMKIPPKVEKHHLDHDHPELDLLRDGNFFDGNTEGRSGAELLEAFLSGKISEAVHPPGPMVDMTLAAQLKPAVFERAVLKHFIVFDNRFEHAPDDAEAKEKVERDEEEGDDGEEYEDEG